MVRFLAVLGVLGVTAGAHGQGLLGRARLATYGKPLSLAPVTSGISTSASAIWSETALGDEGDALTGLGALALAGLLAGGVVASPLWMPSVLAEDNVHNVYFPAHPYALADSGYARPSRSGRHNPEGASPFDHDYLKMWGLRAGLEDGSRGDGVNRLGGRAWFDNHGRVGVTANWDHFTERLPDGRTDVLTLTDLAVTYRIAQSPLMQMHAGLGGRGMFSAGTTRGGFNFLYSADVFPVEPVVVSASAEAGHLNEAFTLRLRATVGAQWHRAEAFVGYDWLRIGGVDLHGPMAGLRLWF